MKLSAIDIGSNSVRLMLWADGKTLYKRLNTTRLGEGLSASGKIRPEAIERTAVAIKEFKELAEEEGAEKVYAFATAAVRSAENRAQFLDRVRQLCGIEVDVISGEEEAKIGLLGALEGKDGGIVDVGGASSEITLQKDGVRLYSKSVNIGTVRLYDMAQRDYTKLEKIIDEKIKEYGEVKCALPMYAIGGTASRAAAVKHNLKQYDPDIINGTQISLEEMHQLAIKLLSMSVEEIKETTICTKSADVVGGGCLLLYKIMCKLGLEKITVSESDNLEGYILQKCGNL
jgi:exopolyphosphatase/guanosine-5'-triphosphate,3'-diphosphate pyrophosphatase